MASRDGMLTQQPHLQSSSAFWLLGVQRQGQKTPPLPTPPQLVADGFSLPFIDEKTESFHRKRPTVKGEWEGGIAPRPPSPSPGR